MTPYLRQGQVGRTTFLRVGYTLAAWGLVGGLSALVAALVSLDVMSGGVESTLAGTLRENDPEALFNAAGWVHLLLLSALAVGVRTFHRRTLRSVLAGEHIRWRQWARALGTAFGTVVLLWSVARGTGWLGSTPITLALSGAVLATVVQGLSVEGIRGYLAQSLAARARSWRIRGHRVAPWLVGGAMLLPTSVPLLALLVNPSVVPFPGARLTVPLVGLYLIGAGLVPTVLMIATDGIEWSVAAQVVTRSCVGLAVVGGISAPSVAAGLVTLLLALSGIVLARRRGISSPSALVEALRVAVQKEENAGAGEVRASPDTPRECRNCGAPLMGRYCHLCGQRRRTEEPSIRLLVERFFDNVLEVDSRIVRTIRLLIFSPGALSAHYFAGRRADFIPPIRLYLVSSFAFFLLFAAFVPDIAGLTGIEEVDVQVHRSTVDSLYARQIPVDSLLPRARFIGDAAGDSIPPAPAEKGDTAVVSTEFLQAERPDDLADSIDVEAVYHDSLVVLEVDGLLEETVRAEFRRRGRGDRQVASIIVPRSAVDRLAADTLPLDSLSQRRLLQPEVLNADDRARLEATPSLGETLNEGKRGAETGWLAGAMPSGVSVQRVLGDSLVVLSVPQSVARNTNPSTSATARGATAETKSGRAATDTVVTVPADSGIDAEDSENEAFRTLLQNAAKVMFLLVPTFALILSLVYLHEPYAHHVIFTLHVHAFAFAVLSLEFAMELAEFSSTIMVPARIGIYGGVFLYLVAAMKRAYGGSWLWTTAAAFVVANLYFIAGTLLFGTAVGLLENAGDAFPTGLF